MPVDSTNAMPSSTSRSDLLGRPVRPWTAGRPGGINGSTSAQSSSLISRGGGEETDDDMPPQPPPTQNPNRPDTPHPTPPADICNVFLRTALPGLRRALVHPDARACHSP